MMPVIVEMILAWSLLLKAAGCFFCVQEDNSINKNETANKQGYKKKLFFL